MLAAALGGYFYFHRAPKITRKEFILLTDFPYPTGDIVFDGTLRQTLATELDESTFLNILSDRLHKVRTYLSSNMG